MRTLIIISHPTMEESLKQQFFKEASSGLSVTWHHLEASYPDGKIDVKAELQLLAQHDRIIFQFPFYWYSSPAHLKIWQDNVLEQATRVLEGKELGIVLTTGVAEKEYQAGGKEE
ncbi:NAD(P)H dehydrogenase, partial [Escherichia coli]